MLTAKRIRILFGVIIVTVATAIWYVFPNPQIPSDVATRQPAGSRLFKPIACKDNVFSETEVEYRKMANQTPGLIEKPYTQSYDTKWSDEHDYILFNHIDIYSAIEAYPKSFVSGDRAYVSGLDVGIMTNYLETVTFEPLSLRVRGTGTVFGKRSNFFVHAQHSASENANTCFDSKARDVSFSLTSFDNKTYQTDPYQLPEFGFLHFTPQYCTTYDFLSASGDIFFTCVSEKTPESLRFLVVLFHESLNETEPNKSALIPVFYGYFDEPLLENFYYSDHLRYYDIALSDGRYFLVSPTSINALALDANGFIQKVASHVFEDTTDAASSYWLLSYSKDVLDGQYLFLGKPPRVNELNPGRVFDTHTQTFVTVADTCVTMLPENKNLYYNSSLDPFMEGPYKHFTVTSLSSTSFKLEQSVASGGCLTDEGNILISISSGVMSCTPEITNVQTCD